MSEKLIDLHTHSTCSDGSMSPRELVRHAASKGLAAIALSDHDSVSGVKDAMDEGKKVGVEVVPAIELSVQSETETHILGYYIDIDHPLLKEALDSVMDARNRRTNELLRGFADGKSVVFVDIGDKFLVGGKIPKELMSDRIHPTEKGYAIWCRAIAPILKEATGK